MSKLHKGKIVTKETKEKMSFAKKGKVFGINNGFSLANTISGLNHLYLSLDIMDTPYPIL